MKMSFLEEKKSAFLKHNFSTKLSQQNTHKATRLTVTVPYLAFPLSLGSVNVITAAFLKKNGMRQEDGVSNIRHLTGTSRTNIQTQNMKQNNGENTVEER